jgi:MFS family permease
VTDRESNRPATPPPPVRSPNLIVAFLLLLNVLNFVDRQLVASLGYQIEQDLGISHAQLGLLYGYAFLVFYTTMGIVLGTVADRWHRPRLIAIGLFIWSAATAVTGAARSFFQISLARMFLGVGESTLSPTAMSMIGDLLPARARSRGVGIYYAGTPIGVGLSLFVTGWLAPLVGWRGCFVVLGVLGAFLVVPLLLIKDPPRGQIDESPSGPGADGERVRASSTGEIFRDLGRAIVACPALPIMLVGGSLFVFFQASLSLVPVWLQAERGFDLKQAAFHAGAVFLFAGLAGSILGGVASDWLQSRMSGGRVYLLCFALPLCVPTGFAYLTVSPHDHPFIFYSTWSVHVVVATLIFGPLFASVQELAPARIRATALAFSIFVLGLAGPGLGPFITGLIGDRASLAQGLKVSVLVGLASIVFFLLAARRFERDRTRAREL